ncbi:YARHG domain-containing protein [candidate division KSB1 bacterium]|nr:YARHG domain-containing protein [candidate division KSB1 bacterium]
MLRFCYYLLIFCLLQPVYGQYYLLPDSDKESLSEHMLAEKSSAFIRYARNEIFARKGYVFQDPDLELYFSNMQWYQPGIKKTIELSEIEQANLNLLKRSESISKQSYKIIFSHKYNDRALYYIAFNKLPQDNSYHDGDFLLLDKDNVWTLECPTIPPEFLFDHEKSRINLTDSFYPLKEKQISIQDFDKDYEYNVGDEIRVRLYGPSDDSEIVYLGMDKDENLSVYFSIPSSDMICSKINSIKMLIKSRIREDLEGTWFHDQEYLFDTNSKRLYRVPNIFLASPQKSAYKCITEIPVYYDARSAAQRESAALVDTLVVGMLVDILQFYRPEAMESVLDSSSISLNHDIMTGLNIGAAQVTYTIKGHEYSGWIHQSDIKWKKLEGLFAVD